MLPDPSGSGRSATLGLPRQEKGVGYATSRPHRIARRGVTGNEIPVENFCIRPRRRRASGVSRARDGASLSVAVAALDHRISARWRCRHRCSDHGTVVVGAARSTGHHREPAGRQHQHCCPSGNQFAARRIHAAVPWALYRRQREFIRSLPFDLQRDIAPVSGLIDYPMVMVAHPSVPARTVAEIIAHVKANPGKVSLASFGTGSASHLAGELFKIMTGVDMVHVPYRGGAPMMLDLVGGQVQVGFDVMTTSLPHIRTGALRALGWQAPSGSTCCRRCRPSPRQFLDMRQGHGRSRRAKGHATGDYRSAQPRY